MAFYESPRFPETISEGASGGPGYLTEVIERDSGHENRNQVWSAARARYDVAHGLKTQAQLDTLIAFFRTVKGRTHGFRFKDWTDFDATSSEGRLGTGAIGTGAPTYQLYKRYTSGSQTEDRLISKIVAASYTIYKNATPVVEGAGAGEFALNANTGIVTFVATDSEAITGHTPGATHVFTTAADIAGLAIGEKVYLTGVTGTAATTLNSIAHTISNKTGAGPYTWTLSTDTTGLTASGGTAFEYPQATDALTAAFEFDVPCRFDTDQMRATIETYGAYTWGQIPIVEIRV